MGFDKGVGTLGRSVPHQLSSETRLGDLDNLDLEQWVLVVPEQGLGDQILFLSDLHKLKSDRLMLVCDPRMRSILARSFPRVIVGQPGLIDIWPELSVPRLGYLPYGSILSRFRRTSDLFYSNAKPNFLIPNPSKVAMYREQLLEHARGRSIVGLSWRGGHWHQQQTNKSVAFTDWFDLLKADDFLFISLQYGNVSMERSLVKENRLNLKFIEGIDFQQDLDDWFALACATDFIFSVSTALVHFTGAAGHRTHIVLPEKQGPWVLGIEDVSHPIYSNTTILRRTNTEPLSLFISGAFQKVIDEKKDEVTVLQR